MTDKEISMGFTLFEKKKSNGLLLKVLGGAALGLLAAGVIMNFSDLKRYIKISTM